MTRKRVGILLSGDGTNALALIEAAAKPDYPATIALVVSNKLEAAGLARAAAAGVSTRVVDHRPHGEDREAHDRLMDAALREADVELVALAGYMRILTPWFVKAWAGKLINIHPSLLPAFPGLKTHKRALEAGVKLHGCSVHWVIDAVDAGPIIGQAAVPVITGDDEKALGARVLAAEHQLYSVCLAAAITGAAAAPGASEVFANPPV